MYDVVRKITSSIHETATSEIILIAYVIQRYQAFGDTKFGLDAFNLA
jgi:hypothetical protein